MSESHLYPSLDDFTVPAPPPPETHKAPTAPYQSYNPYAAQAPQQFPPYVATPPPQSTTPTPAQPSAAASTAPPSSLTLPQTTCTLLQPSSKKPSPLGTGPLTLQTHQTGPSRIASLSINEWEFHIPLAASRADIAPPAAEKDKGETNAYQYDITVPNTARVVRRAGGAGRPVAINGKVRVTMEKDKVPLEIVRQFERVFGVVGGV
ncbi:hypothetical protein HDV00_011059 [Rhizophlyctis rosea]|nr:hypothetical protein HDV00_011059 [Rhizophlyctis rosea]